ncbi:hypothetical protein [Streptomyces sp. NPDC002763]|uniref:hypothetical protein n=1 Tax=Streptomyces sp. NPDC002763 TaxID=3154427 RepID=UPI0033217BF3
MSIRHRQRESRRVATPGALGPAGTGACPADHAADAGPGTLTGARINQDRDIARMTALLDDPAAQGPMGELAALWDGPGDDRPSDEMPATVGVTMFGAGTVATSGFLAMALVYLLTHLTARDLLGDRPDLIGPGVEELLRVNLSIADALPRLALADVRLGDTDIRERTTVRRPRWAGRTPGSLWRSCPTGRR